MVSKKKLPKDWVNTDFGDGKFFKVLGSGIQLFEGVKSYVSTKSVNIDYVAFIEEEITFLNRPSRANMQPNKNVVWFAKMKNTLKILSPNKHFNKTHILSTGFCGIELNNLSQDYLKQILLSDYFNIQKDLLAIGSTQEAINNTKVKKIKVAFPKDIAEQQKIAQVLTKLDETIFQTEQLISKYQRIKTGLMQDLLTKGIDVDGNIRSEETHKFKDSTLGRIPMEWKSKPLYKISEIVSGVTLGNKYEGLKTIELPYLRVANVQDGYLNLDEIKKIKVPYSYIEKYQLLKGDVLMNEGGDNDKLGRGTIWEEQIDICLHQNHVYRVRPNQEKILPRFLAYFSSSDFAKAFFLKCSKQSTNLASISKTQLEVFPIAVPEISEQRHILDYIQKIDDKINISDSNLIKSKSLKKGLMQDLLSGKKRVTSLLKNKSL